MQRCPKCGRTYDTDTQKFCTHDGGRLGPDDAPSSSYAQTAYDLGQTVRTDPFDPEETVTRLPDLNKTVASAPTSEIRPMDTGRPTTPPASPYHPTSQQPAPHQPTPSQPPPSPPMQAPTISYNPLQAQQYYPSQPSPAPGQLPQQPPSPQYMPQQLPQQQAHQPARAARTSSRLPLIIGLVLILVVGGAAAWYFLIYKKGNATSNSNIASANANQNTNTNDDSNADANANTAPTPSPPPPANATQFVNTNGNLDGKLAENYSDFSFYYPNTWHREPKSGVTGASNFIEVERRLPPDFTQENFAVSWYKSSGTFETDSEGLFKQAVELAKEKLTKTLPGFDVVSEGETTVNGIKGYEFRFEGLAKGTEKGDVKFWGRVIFLPPGRVDESNGLQLLMLTTSLAPEVASASDVGVAGELPVILNSFKMGNNK